MRRKGMVVGIVATVLAVLAVGSAASAPSVKTYSRLAASAFFAYNIDYGSNPGSGFNGTYRYLFFYQVNGIAVYDGRTLSALGGMLVDSHASVESDMTEWRGPPPTPRRLVRCSKPGSANGVGVNYKSDTNGGYFTGGGGIGVSNSGLSVNPGSAGKWSIGCSATESLTTHKPPGRLPGPPSIRVPPPKRSLFTQPKVLSIACRDSFDHDWDPSANVPGAHTFFGSVFFRVRFTPFPASQLNATRKRLLDRVGKKIPSPNITTPFRDCA